MFCPRCGQEQVSDQTRFCSRCGLLMSGMQEIIANGGVLQVYDPQPKAPSARKRGVRQGGAMILFGAFFVPLLGVLSNIFYFSTEIVGLAAVVFFLGGFLRLIYAAIFESGNPADKTLEENVVETAQKLMNKKKNAAELPPQQSIPVDNYMPPKQSSWRETNELTPTSVTDNTTKLLSKDE